MKFTSKDYEKVILITEKYEKLEFKEILNKLDVTQKFISQRFEIPYRTVQSWTLGERKCPQYIKSMIIELIVRDYFKSYEHHLSQPPVKPETDF